MTPEELTDEQIEQLLACSTRLHVSRACIVALGRGVFDDDLSPEEARLQCVKEWNANASMPSDATNARTPPTPGASHDRMDH